MKHTCKSLLIMVAIIILSVNLYAGEIHEAVMQGNLARVNALLTEHPDWLNQQDNLGLTPLNLACQEGHLEIFHALLNKGADFNLGDLDNSQPIHLAAKAGQIEMVEELLNRGVDVNQPDNNGVTPLLFSSTTHLETAKYLLEHGADPDYKNERGFTALFYAAIGGNAELLQLYIDHGADVQPAVDGGIVPLHSAASYGRTEVARILIENGAKVEAKTEYDQTPLSWALNANSIGVAKLLIEHGAKINSRDQRNSTPLHNAAQRGNINIIEYFLEQGADINAVDDFGWTPLTMAALANADVVKYLIVRGAEVNPSQCHDKVSRCESNHTATPLHTAAREGNIEIAKALLDNGAKLNVLDEDGLTPLHYAIKYNKPEMVDYLLSRGAFVNIKDNNLNQNELHKAAITGNSEICKALLEAGASVNSPDHSNHSPLEYALHRGFHKLSYVMLANGADDSRLVELLNKPDLLDMNAEPGEAFIWHLGHSGWAIKTANHFMIFDYFMNPERELPDDYSLACGDINCAELNGQKVRVFCSHEHLDHYSDSIFNWRDQIDDIKYVLGHNPPTPVGEYTYAAPHQVLNIDDIKVSTIPATDAGVAYLLEVDGLVIYHGGDHANENVEMSGEYPGEIDYIAGIAPEIDIAFMGVTGCSLGDPESVRAGLFYALDKMHPKVTFPMHAMNNPAAYLEFADSAQARNVPDKIVCAMNGGDRFIYKNGEITKVDIDWTPSEATEQKLSRR